MSAATPYLALLEHDVGKAGANGLRDAPEVQCADGCGSQQWLRCKRHGKTQTFTVTTATITTRRCDNIKCDSGSSGSRAATLAQRVGEKTGCGSPRVMRVSLQVKPCSP